METGRAGIDGNEAVSALFAEVGLCRLLDEFGYIREAFFSYITDEKSARRLCEVLAEEDK